jgi:general secretion pathway protein H
MLPLKGMFARAKPVIGSKTSTVSGRGFTLIELLVVLVLLGLISSLALMTVGGGNQTREMINEVTRMQALLRLAADEAIYSNEEIGVLIEDEGYEFLVWDEEASKWESSTKQALRPRSLPEWLTLDFQREGKGREILGTSVSGEYIGNTDTLEIEESSKKPSFMLLSSGEVDQFVIGVQLMGDSDSRIEIKTDEQGEIVVPFLQQDEDAG